LLYVPTTYRADQPAPLILVFHGARGNEQRGMALLRDFADIRGLLLVAPASRGETWDALLEGFGPDVDYVDAALYTTFERCAVDASRLAVAGFSDGASYALALGLPNGDLFTNIMAFSPVFAPPLVRRGGTKLFISHGTEDGVLPIDVCSRTIVPMIQGAGFDVTYREFEGAHTLPTEVANEALDWFLVK
jgi:phospholipase/carboxylesterase